MSMCIFFIYTHVNKYMYIFVHLYFPIESMKYLQAQKYIHLYHFTKIHLHISINIYTYMCVCVCACIHDTSTILESVAIEASYLVC